MQSKKPRAESRGLRAKDSKLGTKDSQSLSILRGRSMCVHCGHQLAAQDLVPILSWLFLRGRCRYCKKPISWQYPAVELITAVVFVASYSWWPTDLHTTGGWLLFVTWLVAAVGLVALAVYDLRFMLLSNRILYPTFFIALAGQLAYILLFSNDIAHSSWLLAPSILIASGVFWLLFMASNGRWIGYGDVRLGLITGTLLANPAKSAAMIFIASLLGSLVAAPGLISRKKTMNSRLPYGPFLIVATGIVLLFGDSLINWYKSLIGL